MGSCHTTDCVLEAAVCVGSFALVSVTAGSASVSKSATFAHGTQIRCHRQDVKAPSDGMKELRVKGDCKGSVDPLWIRKNPVLTPASPGLCSPKGLALAQLCGK